MKEHMTAMFLGIQGQWYKWGTNDDPRVLEKGKEYVVSKIDQHSSYINLVINGRPYNCVDFICPVHGHHGEELAESNADNNVYVEKRAGVYLNERELDALTSMLSHKIRREERDRKRPKAVSKREQLLSEGHRDKSEYKIKKWGELLDRLRVASLALKSGA